MIATSEGVSADDVPANRPDSRETEVGVLEEALERLAGETPIVLETLRAGIVARGRTTKRMIAAIACADRDRVSTLKGEVIQLETALKRLPNETPIVLKTLQEGIAARNRAALHASSFAHPGG